MKGFKNIWQKKSEIYAAIEIVRKEGDANIYSLLLLQKTESSLVILEKREGIENLNDFAFLVKKKIPVILTISGLGVLFRKIDGVPSADRDQLITQILPNSNPDAFILQYNKNNSGSLFCSLIRKKIVDEICQEFIDFGLFVLDVGIGIFSIAYLITMFEEGTSKVNTQEYKLVFKGEELVDYTKMKNKQNNIYSLGGLEIEGDYLAGFANVFRFIVLRVRTCHLALLINQETELKSYKLIRKYVRLFIAAMFVILIANYILQFNLDRKISKADTELFESRELLNEHINLVMLLNKKKEAVSALGISTERFVSVIIDKMGQELPSSVYLSEIIFNPRMKKAKEGKLFPNNTLVVTGKSSNVKDLNTWISKIEKIEKVKTVKLTDYLFEKKEELAEFNLIITIVD
jgi:hypothetical protein